MKGIYIQSFVVSLFVALIAWPLQSIALSCIKPSSFIIGQCSKTQCSQAFLVEYQFTYRVCGTRKIVTKPDLGVLRGFLQSSDILSEKEKLVLFMRGFDCSDVHITKIQGIDESGYHNTYTGLCSIDLGRLSLVKETSDQFLNNHFSVQEVSGKTFAELQQKFEQEQMTDYLQYFLEAYISPFFIVPLLIMLAALWVQKVVLSPLPVWGKILLVILPVWFQFHVVMDALRPSFGYYSPRFTPLVVTISIYFFLLIRWLIHRRGKNKTS